MIIQEKYLYSIIYKSKLINLKKCMIQKNVPLCYYVKIYVTNILKITFKNILI
jgi:hypothetical protein